MKVEVVQKSFVDDKGNSVGYKSLVVKGAISDIPFEITLKPFDNSKIIKNALINNAPKLDVIITQKITNGKIYERVITTIENLGDVQFNVSSSDLFILKLYEKLKSGK